MIVFNNILTGEEELLEKLFDSEKQNSSSLFTYLNQHCLNIYFKNNDYKKIIENEFIIYPDGIGIYLALRFLFKKNIKRTDATAVNNSILGKIKENKEKVFLIGGNFDKEFLYERLLKNNINPAGYRQGFFNEHEKPDLIEEIRRSPAKYILIGMGVPRQEIFARELGEAVDNKNIICTGNFFEFYFGNIKRAPVIVQKLGLEWFYRILTEPKRLWRRYLIGIPEFLYRILKIKLNN